MYRFFSRRPFAVVHAAVIMVTAVVASPSSAAGRIDANTVIAIPHGAFNGVQYTRSEAMFEGITSNNRPYRVPCQIIAPRHPSQGSGLLLFDWLVRSTVFTAVGQEQADARNTMTDDFLFGLGLGGGHVDLTDSFTNHEDYVLEVAYHAWGLQALGYLLESDADAIIWRAIQSDIGGP